MMFEKEVAYEANIQGRTADRIGITVKTWMSYNDAREDLARHFGNDLPCPAKVTKFKDGTYQVDKA